MEGGQREMGYSLERYRSEGLAPPLQNGKPPSNYEQIQPYYGQGPRHGHEQIQPYYGQGPRHGHAMYHGQPPIQVQLEAEKQSQRGSTKAQQNAAAIVRDSKLERGKVHEGKHAFVVTQLYQNDLHNLDVVPSLPAGKQDSRVASADKTQNYIKQHLNLQTRFAHAQNSGPNEQLVVKAAHDNHNSDLITSFDPMKDRHLWTMWRTAVNGRIVDEVRKLEKKKIEMGSMAVPNYESLIPGMYGKALVATPLKRFIRVDDESKAIADQMSSYGRLEASQFVYYGLPRAYVSHRK